MRPRLPLLLGALALAGCDSLERVGRPLPESFAVRVLDGSRVERDGFVGRAWVLAVWLPG